MAYRPEKTNDAYALSRLNTGKQSNGEDEYESVREIVENCMPVALSPREMEQASTCNDADLGQVKGCVRAGIWERCTVSLNVHTKDDSELCIYGEILLRGTRIVVPKTFRDKVVRLAHEGHQSIVETKYQLHSKVWWPIMDRDVEQLSKVCHGCQRTSRYDKPERMSHIFPPSAPCQGCCTDLLAPLPTRESNLFVQYFSRFLK